MLMYSHVQYVDFLPPNGI